MRPARLQITIDCRDPARQGQVWAQVLGYPTPDIDAWHSFLRGRGVGETDLNSTFALDDAEGVFPRLFLQRVPEAKTAKNRMHLDVAATGEGGDRSRVDAEVGRLVGLGATIIGPVSANGGYWMVMADPEGNEFCVD